MVDPTHADVLFVADTGNNRVRRIDLQSHTVQTVFGSGTCAAGMPPAGNAAATTANLCAPGDMAIDGSGTVYVFDLTKSAIWRFAATQAGIIAGNGTALAATPTTGGTAATLSLGPFTYLAADVSGRFLYLNEFFGLRQMDLTAGTISAPLDLGVTTNPLRSGSPVGIDPLTGRVIYAIYPVPPPQGGGGCDPQIDPGCTGGGSTPPVTESIFSYDPSSGTRTQIAGQGNVVAPFLSPTSTANLGVSTNGLGELVAIAPSSGAVGALVASRSGWIHSMDSLGVNAALETILGNGSRSYCGDGGPAIAACLDDPTGVAANPDGSFFIADSGNGVVRFVDVAGNIHSLVSPLAAGTPPTSIALFPAGADQTGFIAPVLPAGTLVFTSAPRNQVFTLDPLQDQTALLSGKGCTADVDPNCSPNDDAGLGAAAFDAPRGVAIDSVGNPFVADTLDNAIRCLGCTDAVISVAGGEPNQASDPSSGRPSQQTALNLPVATAIDTDNGLLIAEKGGQTVRRVSPDPEQGYLYPFNSRVLIVSDVMPGSSIGASFAPVGVAVVPGHVLVSDAGSARVLSTTRAGGACGPSTSLTVTPFAGGGTSNADNIPAVQAAFGKRMIELGVFDPAGGLGEIAAATVNGQRLVYITDLASGRIRLVNAGGNHPPVANAGPDQTIAPDTTHVAHGTLDGSASTDPDCDTLTYTWSGPDFNAPLHGEIVDTGLSGIGVHTITLTVSDGFGGVSSATMHILVSSLDIGITATPSAGTIDPGNTLTYTATVTNNGPADATGVGVTLLPATSEFVSATVSQGTCNFLSAGSSSGYVQCLIGSLANGASAHILIVLRPATVEILNNSLNVFADQADSNPANDSVTMVTGVGEPAGGGGTGNSGGSGPGGGGVSGTCTLYPDRSLRGSQSRCRRGR